MRVKIVESEEGVPITVVQDEISITFYDRRFDNTAFGSVISEALIWDVLVLGEEERGLKLHGVVYSQTLSPQTLTALCDWITAEYDTNA